MRKVDITFGFAASICGLAWMDGWLCLWFLIALICHESGHFLTMKFSGAPVYGLRLSAAGAMLRGGFAGYRQELACAAAGPLFSALLCACCFRWQPKLAVVSAVLGLVNLLPVYPLDGGRILRAALLLHLEQTVVGRILRWVTALVCCFLMIGACWAAAELQAGLWPVFAVLVILWRVGQADWQER